MVGSERGMEDERHGAKGGSDRGREREREGGTERELYMAGLRKEGWRE